MNLWGKKYIKTLNFYAAFRQAKFPLSSLERWDDYINCVWLCDKSFSAHLQCYSEQQQDGEPGKHPGGLLPGPPHEPTAYQKLIATNPQQNGLLWTAVVTYGTLEVPAGSGCEKYLPISKRKSTQGQQKGSWEVLGSHTCGTWNGLYQQLERSYSLEGSYVQLSWGDWDEEATRQPVWACVQEGPTLQMCDVSLHTYMYSKYWTSILLS